MNGHFYVYFDVKHLFVSLFADLQHCGNRKSSKRDVRDGQNNILPCKYKKVPCFHNFHFRPQNLKVILRKCLLYKGSPC